MFGEFIKQKRLEKDLSLREFCRQLDEDASNWSRVEREKASPPRDEKKLEKIAKIVGIRKDTDEWNRLYDLAMVDAGIIPDYVMSDKTVLEALPVFFRTIGNTKPTKEDLQKMVETIRKGV